MSFFTKLAVAAVFVAVLVYIFGLPPQLKRKLERSAVQNLGQNQASNFIREGIQSIPDSNDRDLNQLKSEAAAGLEGLSRNGVGKATGEFVDTLNANLRNR